MVDEPISRELFNARFDALEAKMAAWVTTLEKENNRQDEAIERIADRSTHIAETRRLTERVQKLEDQVDLGRTRLNDLGAKVKITWGIGTILAGIFISIITAIIRGWIGV
jgi:predicted nuclease with TOPRIM domain